ncbi:hypothetical protein KORDIASMS9_04044 [Kordia sp. SMS9]|uniref:hypothetical protein n=1 Tax=Kordia sp. SMS9 TaxID=2282170 RepID=UPI000E10D995|nr:hypothetical protein [Kordia sp. SMS9]AXG71786.1 hypothetical protein KORDIASMS9_04044 [Kordia sp. SMS9]
MKFQRKHHLLIKSFALIILMVSIYACSEESTNTQDQTDIDFSNIEIDLSKSSFGKAINVFKYTDKEELLGKIDAAMHHIITDSNDLIKNSETTDLLLDINFSDGKAVILGIIEFNSDTKKILSAHYFDQKTNTYAKSVPGDLENIDLARCLQGYTQLASCGNLSNPQQCVSNAVASYLSAEISNIGDCANVQVQVGTFTTKVCGKNC